MWIFIGIIAIVIAIIVIGIVSSVKEHGGFINWRKHLPQEQKEASIKKQEARDNVNAWLSQLNNCGKILKSTYDPEIFFSRFEMLVNVATKLSDAKNAGHIQGNFSHDLDVAFHEATVNRRNPINDFINKTYRKMLKECGGLKSMKGKVEKIEKFFMKLAKYFDQMEVKNVERVQILKDECDRLIESWNE